MTAIFSLFIRGRVPFKRVGKRAAVVRASCLGEPSRESGTSIRCFIPRMGVGADRYLIILQQSVYVVGLAEGGVLDEL